MDALSQIRSQYPAYADLTDQQLADGLYQKHYSDMPREQFDSKIGMNATNPAKEEPIVDPMSGQVIGSSLGSPTPRHTGRAADAMQFTSTAAAKGGGGLLDFLANGPQGMIRNLLPGPFKDIANIENSTPKLPGVPAQPGQAVTDAYFRNIIPEYKPQTMGGRLAMDAAAGGFAGAPFGLLGAGIGAASSLLGGGAAEAGLPDYAQAGASLLPALLGKPSVALAERMFSPVENRVARRIGSLQSGDAGVGAKNPDQITADLLQTNQPPWFPPKPLTLADTAGPAVQGEAERVAQLPQESGAIARTALEGRATGTANRMNDDADIGMGNGDSAFNTVNAIMTKRKAVGAPLFEDAFKANQNVASPEIDSILSTPAGTQALASARVKMQNARTNMGVPDPELTEQARDTGQVTSGGVASGLTMRTLHYTKMSLDDQIRSARMNEPSAVPGLVDLKNSLLREMDNQDATAVRARDGTIKTPGKYAQGRAVWSDDSSAMDAVNQGTQVFKKSPDQVTQELGALDPGDQEMYRLGIKSAYKDMIGNRGGLATANKLTKDDADYMRQRIRPAFSSDDDFNAFIKSADQESTMGQTNNRLLQNSATMRRALQQHDLEGDGVLIPGLMGAAAAVHEPFLGIPMMARAAARGISSLYNGYSPKFNAEMARQLFTMDPAGNRAILERIAAQGNRQNVPLIAPTLLSGPTNLNLLGGPGTQ